MNKDVFTDLSDLRALVVKLTEQNAALRAQLAQTWQPVPNNEALDCECGACHQVAANIAGGIMVSNRTEAMTLLFDNVRLCRLVQP